MKPHAPPAADPAWAASSSFSPLPSAGSSAPSASYPATAGATVAAAASSWVAAGGFSPLTGENTWQQRLQRNYWEKYTRREQQGGPRAMQNRNTTRLQQLPQAQHQNYQHSAQQQQHIREQHVHQQQQLPPPIQHWMPPQQALLPQPPLLNQQTQEGQQQQERCGNQQQQRYNWRNGRSHQRQRQQKQYYQSSQQEKREQQRPQGSYTQQENQPPPQVKQRTELQNESGQQQQQHPQQVQSQQQKRSPPRQRGTKPGARGRTAAADGGACPAAAVDPQGGDAASAVEEASSRYSSRGDAAAQIPAPKSTAVSQMAARQENTTAAAVGHRSSQPSASSVASSAPPFACSSSLSSSFEAPRSSGATAGGGGGRTAAVQQQGDSASAAGASAAGASAAGASAAGASAAGASAAGASAAASGGGGETSAGVTRTRKSLPRQAEAGGHAVEDLPIMQYRETIMKHIREHAVTCIQGETGCGKSTRIPYFLLQEEKMMAERDKQQEERCTQQQQQQETQQRQRGGGWQRQGGDETAETGAASGRRRTRERRRLNVFVTQPRRLACIALARRVAQEIGEPLGRSVGYRISGDAVCSAETKVCFMTTGYLLQLLTHNPQLLRRSVTHLVFDEVHERSLKADLLSLVTKLLLAECQEPQAGRGDSAGIKGERPKLVVMSATMQGNLFAEYFTPAGHAPPSTIFVGAKRFPVQQLYLDDLLLQPASLLGRRLPQDELAGEPPTVVGLQQRSRTCQQTNCIGRNEKNKKLQEQENEKEARKTAAAGPDGDVNVVVALLERSQGGGGLLVKASGASLIADAMAYFAGGGRETSQQRRQRGKPTLQGNVRPKVLEGLERVCYELVTALGCGGETVLIFLPGIGEIFSLYELFSQHDTVYETTTSNGGMGMGASAAAPVGGGYDSRSSTMRCLQGRPQQPPRERRPLVYRFFALHSSINREEQEAVFLPPPPGTVHVVLASNIAESSLTLPCVRVVIDFCLRRQMVREPRRQTTALVRTWTSQASSQQRLGRTACLRDLSAKEDARRLVEAPNAIVLEASAVSFGYVFRWRNIFFKKPEKFASISCLLQHLYTESYEDVFGRVFPGVAIRLVPRWFYEACMPRFDQPETETDSLEKLYLTIKHFTGELNKSVLPQASAAVPKTADADQRKTWTTSDVLQHLIEPPDILAILSVRRMLFRAGALTADSEDATVSSFGKILMRVPVSLELVKLLTLGIAAGCTLDAVVLVTVLSSQDPFTMPAPVIVKNPLVLSQKLQLSFKSRVAYDAGHYSEPLMLRNLFVDWLTAFAGSMANVRARLLRYKTASRGPSREQHINMKVEYIRVAREFAREHSVVASRLVQMAASALDIAVRVRQFLRPGCAAAQSLTFLIDLLRHSAVELPPAATAGCEEVAPPCAEQQQQPQVGPPGTKYRYRSAVSYAAADAEAALQERVSHNLLLLKALLAAAFAPNWLLGTPTVKISNVDLRGVARSIALRKRHWSASESAALLMTDADPTNTLVVDSSAVKGKMSAPSAAAARAAVAVCCAGQKYLLHEGASQTGDFLISFGPLRPKSTSSFLGRDPGEEPDQLQLVQNPYEFLTQRELELHRRRMGQPERVRGHVIPAVEDCPDDYYEQPPELQREPPLRPVPGPASHLDTQRGQLQQRLVMGRTTAVMEEEMHQQQRLQKEGAAGGRTGAGSTGAGAQQNGTKMGGRTLVPAAHILNHSALWAHGKRELRVPLPPQFRLSGAAAGARRETEASEIPGVGEVKREELGAGDADGKLESGAFAGNRRAREIAGGGEGSGEPAEDSVSNQQMNVSCVMKCPASPFLVSWTALVETIEDGEESEDELESLFLGVPPGSSPDLSSGGGADSLRSITERLPAATNCRNPIGFYAACPTLRGGKYLQDTQVYGIASSIQRREEGNLCWAEGVTVLPRKEALLLLLAFAPPRGYSRFTVRVDPKDPDLVIITGVSLYGGAFTVSLPPYEGGPRITIGDLCRMNKLRKILSNLFSSRGGRETAAAARRRKEAATAGRQPAARAAESHAANRWSSHGRRSASRCTRDSSSGVERSDGMEEEMRTTWLRNLTGENKVHAYEYGVSGSMVHTPDPRSERREMNCAAGAAGAGNAEGTVAGAAGTLLPADAAAAEEEEGFVDLNEDPDVRNAFLELLQQCNCECPAEDKYATLTRELRTLPRIHELLTAVEEAENSQFTPSHMMSSAFVEGSDALLPIFDVFVAFKCLVETIEKLGFKREMKLLLKRLLACRPVVAMPDVHHPRASDRLYAERRLRPLPSPQEGRPPRRKPHAGKVVFRRQHAGRRPRPRQHAGRRPRPRQHAGRTVSGPAGLASVAGLRKKKSQLNAFQAEKLQAGQDPRLGHKVRQGLRKEGAHLASGRTLEHDRLMGDLRRGRTTAGKGGRNGRAAAAANRMRQHEGSFQRKTIKIRARNSFSKASASGIKARLKRGVQRLKMRQVQNGGPTESNPLLRSTPIGPPLPPQRQAFQAYARERARTYQ